MKKQLSILISSLLIFQSGYALAEPMQEFLTAENITSASAATYDTVPITLSLKDGYCHSSDGQAVLDISDATSTYTKIVNIGNSTPTQEVTFYVDPYTFGKTFYITPISGIDKLFLNGIEYNSQNPLPITADDMLSGIINVQYIPSYHNALNVAVNGQTAAFSSTARNIGQHVILPIDEMAEALSLGYSYNNGIHTVASLYSSFSIDSNANTAYIDKPSTGKIQTELPVSPQIISDSLFVPVSLFESAFNLTLLTDYTGEKPTLYVATGALVEDCAENKFINSTGLSSQTDYLIWISKSEYKVRVFAGYKGNWNLIKTLTCAIGAPRTPTCEGTYRYYQAQSMWDYGSYYVGPIMRFNGGYAIHSTLIYKNGTPKDNRVGMRLSLGCIRLQPPDINWLFSIIPLYTTIHITA